MPKDSGDQHGAAKKVGMFTRLWRVIFKKPGTEPEVSPEGWTPKSRVPQKEAAPLRPDVISPELRTPDLRTPDFSTPDRQAPDWQAPKEPGLKEPIVKPDMAAFGALAELTATFTMHEAPTQNLQQARGLADGAIGWLSQYVADEAPETLKLMEFDALPREEQGPAVVAALTMANQIATALILGAGRELKDPSGALLRAAFGAEDWAIAARKPMTRFDGVLLPKIDNSIIDPDILKKLNRFIADRTRREYEQTLAQCGWLHRETAARNLQIRPIGAVTGLAPPRGCAGSVITVSFRSMGAQPPPPGWQVFVVVPTETGVSQIRFWPGRSAWQDAGVVDITLPQGVASGPVGFFLVPPPSDPGGCGPGTLTHAATAMQSAFKDVWGESGFVAGQRQVEIAMAVEVQAFGGLLPLPSGAQGDPHWLEAGPPRITKFHLERPGFIYPENRVVLLWDTHNATEVVFSTGTVMDSENPPEITIAPTVHGRSGRLEIPVPVTRRWMAKIVMTARNPNGCGEVTAELEIDSGFTHYCVGVGKTDCTDYRPGIGMQGFAFENQKSSGRLLEWPAGPNTQGVGAIPLYARAYVITPNGPPSSQNKPLALIVCDIWSGSGPVKREVLARLRARHPTMVWENENVVLSGTHTHSGTGGYLGYFLYNMSGGGYDQVAVDRLATTIVAAVDTALNARAPARIEVAKGDLVGCGGNRSLAAHQRNIGRRHITDPNEAIDREMLLLQFSRLVRSKTGSGAFAPTGMINWYGIHPTNIGMYNDELSGDNKGLAAARVEASFGAGFVAAFANAAAGDVSGNLVGGPPVGKRSDPAAFERDINRMIDAAERQASFALSLARGPKTEVTGPLRFAHTFVDMADFRSKKMSPGGTPTFRTFPAALGVSFGAGSSEDSEPIAATIGELKLRSGIPEGINADGFAAMTAAAMILHPLLFAAGVTAPLAIAAFFIPGVNTAVMARAGVVLFSTLKADRMPPAPDQTYRYEWQFRWAAPSLFMSDGHYPKPIMFSVGDTRLRRFSLATNKLVDRIDYPMVPNVIPMQLVAIGDVALAAVPAEFNAMAGIRLKETVLTAAGGALNHVAIAGFANEYSGYVATVEEYEAQHYEGASTLYGKATLAAYQEVYEGLTDGLLTGASVPSAPEFITTLLHRK
jgi:neutral ceramidase